MKARNWFHGMTAAPLPAGNENRSLCRECSNVFSTTANFDKHRIGAHGTAEKRCIYPGFRGLEIKALVGGFTVWGKPWKEGIYSGSNDNV